MNSTKYLLTDRQREVVDLRLQGYTHKQVAEKLGITPHTVKSYLMIVYEKLEVHSVNELYGAMLALQEQEASA
jgi:DNA-binding CsgD family transcriptional regulator